MVGHLIEGAPRRVVASMTGSTGRVLTSVLYSGLIAAAIMAVLVFFIGIKPAGGEVATVSADTVGDCVTVADGTGTSAPCDAAGTTFVVAQRLAAGAAGCAAPSYLKLRGEGGGTLCVAPNLAVGTCYATGAGFPATADIRAVPCPTGLSEHSGGLIRVTERAIGGPLNCTDQTAVNFDLPQRFGYCTAGVA